MADGGRFDCSICLQLLEDPVTTACGHSYCIRCINLFWDRNTGSTYSCPQCRQTFSSRPDLKRNTLLADVLEEQKSWSDAAVDTYASPGDVQCDACTQVKRKAHMFCLVCLASFCESHLKPHYDVPPLKKHKLILASAKVKDSICSHHDKLLEIYCRTDRQFICLLCMNEHRGHDTVSAAEEKGEMQTHLERMKKEVADRLLVSERNINEMTLAADTIRDAAWEVCVDFERLCEEHVRSYARSVERKCSAMREMVGGAEKAGVDWTDVRLRRLKHQVSELRRLEDKLNLLSLVEDPIQFVQGLKAVDNLPKVTDSQERPDAQEFAAAQKEKMTDLCNKEKTKILNCVREMNDIVFKPPRVHGETPPRTFLLARKCSNMKVDPNIIPACLCLSDRTRTISWGVMEHAHPDHPDRFTYYHQALCKDGLTGSHYWEVEWDGGVVEVAVAYKDISRKGSGKDCCFGHNGLSWKLVCFPTGCTFWHDNLFNAQIPPVHSRKVGVHLDYPRGTLCFYGVCGDGSLTLLHRVKTTFSKPLYPGFCVDLGSTLKICNI